MGSTTKLRMSSLRLTMARTGGEGREAVLDEAAGVSAVGPDQGQQVVRGSDLGEQDLGRGAVAHIRCGDHHREQ
ncbi:hypothetical protein ACFZDJ_27595 [Streptomyces sp. NPDC007896]|uniref:hypothetical protein n=1 Tax=Streptomyces sp. NPDC007896 TaxID=3364784 RepID=UPI0036E4BE71